MRSPARVCARPHAPRRRLLAPLAACAPAAVAIALMLALPVPAGAIVGGSEVKSIDELPFQVALYDPQVDANPANSQFCGGVVLDASHVLTAAHCVFDEATGQASRPGEIAVLAGTTSLGSGEQGEGAVEDPVIATSFDPQWQRSDGEHVNGEHDLGVLTLKNELRLKTGTIEAIKPFESLAQATALKAPATVSGWGDEHAEPPSTARPSYPTRLRSVQIPILTEPECESSYLEAEQLDSRLITPVLGPDFVCAGEAGHDACYGDSGGPLVVGPEGGTPADLRLLGTVDLGVGCGQAKLPSAYQSVVEEDNARFIAEGHRQGPQLATGGIAPTLTGTPAAGQTLTCHSGVWASEAKFSYEFFVDESTLTQPAVRALTPLMSESSSYLVASTLAPGTRIFCAVFATNAGGFAEVFTPDVTLAGAPSPSPGPSPAPSPVVEPAPGSSATPSPSSSETSQPTSQGAVTTSSSGVAAGAASAGPPAAPTLRLVSKACRHATCTVNVLASEGSGMAAVATVEALLTFLQPYPCHEGRRHFTCTRLSVRRLTAKATPAGHFVILAGGLKPTSYVLSLTAIDRAGVRQGSATHVGLVVKRAARKVR
jgi:secreted trypsin-like serine protease